RSPHKSELPIPGVHRLEMIRRAIESTPSFSVSDCELNRSEPSYTIDTIKYFRKKWPDALLYWLIGADQLEDFGKWHKVTELLDICRVCVMYRAGYQKPDFKRFKKVFSPEHITQLQQDVMQTPLFDISSTDIRRCLAGGKSVTEMLPDSVIQYIGEYQLYGYAH
nr:nicotinate (nicotinamide) nucleotide adenylyltransferase [Planctomycetota bacterium]